VQERTEIKIVVGMQMRDYDRVDLPEIDALPRNPDRNTSAAIDDNVPAIEPKKA
jgi:hypothetical protein